MDPPESVPLLAVLPEALAMRVRALGEKTLADEMLPLIADLEALRVWTDEELGRLLERQSSTVRRLRRVLRAGTRANPTQPPPDNDA
jgi:hypothetical protein